MSISLSNISSSSPTVPVVTITSQKPETVSVPNSLEAHFPPPPTSVGVFTEVITKSTFTEAVTTRVTNNTLSFPNVKEMRKLFQNENH